LLSSILLRCFCLLESFYSTAICIWSLKCKNTTEILATRMGFEPTRASTFNDWGTPVVPIRKTPPSGRVKAKLRACSDYSVTVNPQVEVHRHPLPLPEGLMNKLGGGYGFTKIDLADAYNQIKLGPISRKRLALSTHQNVLPFGINSAPGYLQRIM